MGTGDRPARWNALAAVLGVVALVAGAGACAGPDRDGSVRGDGPTATGRADRTDPGDPRDPATGGTADGPSSAGPGAPDGRTVTVTSITDGDTFRAGGERVRLIGIDAPEVHDAECGADAATSALARLIPVGSEVVLVPDVEPTDRYDRTLAYVHRASDGLHVNLALAREGYVTPLVVAPNDTHAADIDAAVRAAVADRRGLWDGTCPAPVGVDGGGFPSSTPPPPTGPASTRSGSGGPGCDPAYPTVCIPPSPPDLDCGDIPHRRFPVLPPDPHRFDGGGDGIGCER